MNALNTSTLRPGLLVSLKTSAVGNVSYARIDIEPDHVVEETGERKAKWETHRTIADAVEFEAAQKARSKAHHMIRGVCVPSAFGLLCPETDAEKLNAAVAGARAVCEEFNASAKLTRVQVYVIAGKIAPDDVEAVKAINSEIKDLLADMERGVANCDVKVIREAASKAKSVGAMLSPEMQGRVQVAVDVARAAARKVVAAGEQAAVEVDKAAITRITEMRTAFLDLDDAKPVKAPVAPGVAVDMYVDTKPEDRFIGKKARNEFIAQQNGE